MYVRSRIEIANSQLRTTYKNIDDGSYIAYNVARTGQTHIIQLPLKNDYVLFGFVSKGSEIELAMLHNVSDFQNGDSSHTAYGLVGGSYLSTQIIECKIY